VSALRTRAIAAATAFDHQVIATPEEFGHALARLADDDAASIDFLSPEGCADEATPVIGEGERAVRQDFQICMPVPDGSPFHACRDKLERLLARALAAMPAPPLDAPPRLNDLVVQRYPVGSLGITAHRDHVGYRDLVAIVTIAGQARFFISSDRSGENAREVPLLLMRAPGFAGRDDRPFHFLNEVSEERVCLGLRRDVRVEAGSV
jgi:hypothetical protein